MNLPRFLLLAGLTTACASSTPPPVVPAPNYDAIEAATLKQLAPLIPGRWTLAEVHYMRRPMFPYPPSLPRDTVFSQFATLTLVPAPMPLASAAGRPEFEGQLTYHGQTYPVYFSLRAAPEWIVHHQGPPAYFLLEYNFPVGSHPTASAEQFLQDIGLVGADFSLEATAGPATMQWRGLSRHLTAITLRQ